MTGGTFTVRVAALLVTEHTRVLVDAGFSARKLGQLLATVGQSLHRIDAVFLTHEHGDHAGGIEGLKKFPHIRIFANESTRRAVQAALTWRADWQIFETGARFVFRDLQVETFAVPHDAQDPVGFLLRTTAGNLGFVTDLGHATKLVVERIRPAHH
jgi:phosphoribosyl 1,2-cyclic phosphodiesterase